MSRNVVDFRVVHDWHVMIHIGHEEMSSCLLFLGDVVDQVIDDDVRLVKIKSMMGHHIMVKSSMGILPLHSNLRLSRRDIDILLLL